MPISLRILNSPMLQLTKNVWLTNFNFAQNSEFFVTSECSEKKSPSGICDFQIHFINENSQDTIIKRIIRIRRRLRILRSYLYIAYC